MNIKRALFFILISFIVFFFTIIIFYKTLIFTIINDRYSGLIHFKIATDIKEQNIDVISGLNNWMADNYITKGLNENFLPVLDKNSYYRLINGYSVCDGSADTYIRIAKFLNIRGYVIPLYSRDLNTSVHSVTLFTPSKKNKSDINFLRENALVIDPVYNISFKKNKEYVNMNDICLGNYNNYQKKYLENQNYKLEEFYCYTKNVWITNDILEDSFFIKKIYYLFLDYVPNSLLLKIHEIFIEKKLDEHEFFQKARHYHLFGNYKLAKKYYNLSIINDSFKDFDIFEGAHKDDNFKKRKKNSCAN